MSRATKLILLAAAFVAATLQGSRLPNDLPLQTAPAANVAGDRQRACTPDDERAGSACVPERMWA